MKKARRWALGSVAIATMWAGLVGPAPGNVGGCGSGTEIANAESHCNDREFWYCRRDHFEGRIDDTQFNNCLARIEEDMRCIGFTWPPGCEPTPAQADACILLLQRQDLSYLETDQLLAMYDECNLCP